jgi:hypothetical protein
VSRDDLAPEDVLSATELAEHYRAKRDRAMSCSDRMCGGSPACGVPLEDAAEEVEQ